MMNPERDADHVAFFPLILIIIVLLIAWISGCAPQQPKNQPVRILQGKSSYSSQQWEVIHGHGSAGYQERGPFHD